ncbi:MAG: carboxymuconolactone decarboxylase family protein [Gemmatimonadetes bacterium]|nr:carboxymuconolactone decarboxylase family protein [Gemmatimonadota bacterium]
MTAETTASPDLEDLIPIAVVIAAGCEPCAEKMVRRALGQGSTPKDIRKTLGLVAHMQNLDCLAENVGRAALARMEKPLAAGKRTLESELSQVGV